MKRELKIGLVVVTIVFCLINLVGIIVACVHKNWDLIIYTALASLIYVAFCLILATKEEGSK